MESIGSRSNWSLTGVVLKYSTSITDSDMLHALPEKERETILHFCSETHTFVRLVEIS
jgi:hypothetical protein